jgi:hypothetical protein
MVSYAGGGPSPSTSTGTASGSLTVKHEFKGLPTNISVEELKAILKDWIKDPQTVATILAVLQGARGFNIRSSG